MECKHCYATKKQHATMRSHKFEPAVKSPGRGMTLEQLEDVGYFRKRTKSDAEREGRYQRLNGVPREWLAKNTIDERKADILRGYDRSEEQWQKILSR